MNKRKVPQKAPALKRLIPVVKIKMTCLQKVTAKAGKSHIITIFCELICIPPLEVFQLLQASSSCLVCSPSPKHCQGIIEGPDHALLLVKHRVFVEELAILQARQQLIDEQLLAICEGIDHIDEEVEVLN